MSSIVLSIFLLSIGASFIQRTTGFGFGIFIMTMIPTATTITLMTIDSSGRSMNFLTFIFESLFVFLNAKLPHSLGMWNRKAGETGKIGGETTTEITIGGCSPCLQPPICFRLCSQRINPCRHDRRLRPPEGGA